MKSENLQSWMRRRRDFKLWSYAPAVMGIMFAFSVCQAFEIGTHAGMSKATFEQSDLGAQDRALLRQLGFIGKFQQSLGREYFDRNDEGTSLVTRRRWPYETSIIERVGGASQSYDIAGWLMAGAVREDDSSQFAFGMIGGTPVQDEPSGRTILRPLNHFFDPVNDRPLVVVSPRGKKSPDWALGTIDAFASPQLDSARVNHYSLADANEALFRALTLRGRASGSGVSQDLGITGMQERARATQRYWATTFRALGDVVHLIQDMGQPQHTRNSPHNGTGPTDLITGHVSLIEKYLEERALLSVSSSNGQPVSIQALNYGSRAPVSFNSYLSYWTTSPTEAFADRRGLADFSNREFLTPLHPQSPAYASPPVQQLTACNQPPESLGYSIDGGGVPVAPFRQLCGQVRDARTGETYSDVPLIAKGLVWVGVPETGGVALQTYVLTKQNVDRIAEYLVPRAVAYGSGALNRFFRGRLEIMPPASKAYAVIDHSLASSNAPNAGGFRTLKLRVKNVTANVVDGAASYPQDMTGGTLDAVVKFYRNVCYQPNLSGEYGSPGVSMGACRSVLEEKVASTAMRDASGASISSVALIAQGADKEVTFEFSSPIPIDATDIHLQLVYRGAVGSDPDAIAVGTKDISEPNFVALHNPTDYLVCVGHSWYRHNTNGTLSPNARQAIVELGGSPDDPAVQAELAPQTFVRASFSLANTGTPFASPLVEKLNLNPGEFVRFAYLTEANLSGQEQHTYALSLQDYVFFANQPSLTAINQRVYGQDGNAIRDSLTLLDSFRGTLGQVSLFGYRRYPYQPGPGLADCTGVPFRGTALDQNPTPTTIKPLSIIGP